MFLSKDIQIYESISKKLFFVFILGFGMIAGIFVWGGNDIYHFLFHKKYVVADAKYSLLKEAASQGLKSYSVEDSRKDILAFITKQFDNYRADGIELKQIENLYNLSPELKEHFAVCRVQIIDDQVYADHEKEPIVDYCKRLVAGLYRAMQKHKINNVDFILFAADDFPPVNQEVDLMVTNSPFFLMSKDLESPIEKNALLLPDAFLLQNRKWPKVFYQIQKASQNYKWEDKIPKIFWRGSTTGGDIQRGFIYKLDNYAHLPRLSLVMMSKSFPNLIDARFVSFVQFSEAQSSQDLYMVLSTLFPEVPKVLPEEDHLAYKYLISIDGNTCAWLRVPWILLSNSVLLKQESKKIEMFYAGLKPYVHYVPVSEDISDVFEKLRWLQHHDKEARIISENATKFVEANLTQDDIDEYLAITLNEYHKLQKFEVKTPTLPPITKTWLKVMGL